MKRIVSAVLGLSLGIALVGMPAIAPAQNDDVANRNISSLDFTDADVREAIRVLFRMVGAEYTIEPDVQGTVTIALQNRPFETVLRAILDQVNATWRRESGIYFIQNKKDDVIPDVPDLPDVPTTSGTSFARIPIRSIDPALLIQLLGGDAVDLSGAQPENSSLFQGGFGGGGFGGGGFGGGGFGGGGFGGGGFGGGGFGGGGFGGGFGGGRGPGGGGGGGGFSR